MNFRTDLAVEVKEFIPETQMEGIESSTEQSGNFSVSVINIKNEAASQRMGKPIGEYVTVTCPPFSDSSDVDADEVMLISKQISNLLPKQGKLALVVGLGNRDITPDALGPQVVENTLATRHISEEIKRAAGLESLRPVAALSPGVLGQTGVETAEITHSVVKEIQPDVVIVIDALASRSVSRLGTTVQISNVGISPGSGVMNKRKELSEDSLGVPVIAIGVPTVVDAMTLALDISGANYDDLDKEKIEPKGRSMMVTPKEIDLIIQRASKVVALAINSALQPDLSLDDIMSLVS